MTLIVLVIIIAAVAYGLYYFLVARFTKAPTTPTSTATSCRSRRKWSAR